MSRRGKSIETESRLVVTRSRGERGIKNDCWSLPGGSVVKNLRANAGDTGSIPGLRKSHTMWVATKSVHHNY